MWVVNATGEESWAIKCKTCQYFFATQGVLSWSISYSVHADETWSAVIGVVVLVVLVVLSYLFFVGVSRGSFRYDWDLLQTGSAFLSRQFNSLKLVLNVVFSHPPGPESSAQSNQVQPLRLLFTDQTKVKLRAKTTLPFFNTGFFYAYYTLFSGGDLCRRPELCNPDDRVATRRGGGAVREGVHQAIQGFQVTVVTYGTPTN